MPHSQLLGLVALWFSDRKISTWARSMEYIKQSYTNDLMKVNKSEYEEIKKSDK